MGALALFTRPTVEVFGRSFLLFDVGGVVATAGLALALGVSIARNTRRLYLAETIPRAPMQ
jgi:hypothetical protein